MREAKQRMRLRQYVHPEAISTWIENDPITAWSLSRFDQTEVDLIFSIVRLAIELWSLPERN